MNYREPAYVNMSKREWEIEEAMQNAAAVGAMINADLEALMESLPHHFEDWEKHYDLADKLEMFHHDILKLISQARFLGIRK